MWNAGATAPAHVSIPVSVNAANMGSSLTGSRRAPHEVGIVPLVTFRDPVIRVGDGDEFTHAAHATLVPQNADAHARRRGFTWRKRLQRTGLIIEKALVLDIINREQRRPDDDGRAHIRNVLDHER